MAVSRKMKKAVRAVYYELEEEPRNWSSQFISPKAELGIGKFKY